MALERLVVFLLWDGGGRAEFSTYAWSCLVGSVKRLRARSSLIRVWQWSQVRPCWQAHARQAARVYNLEGRDVGCMETRPQGQFDVPGRSPFPAPDRAADVTLVREAVRAVLESLSPRQRRVIRLRYGLDNGHCCSLTECGLALRVTKERVRQLEMAALARLRLRPRADRLRPLLGCFS